MKQTIKKATNSKAALALAGLVMILIFVVAGALVFFLGNKYGVGHMSFKSASASQAASAMQKDEFYSDYRENTLFVQGTVGAINLSKSGFLVTFNTSTAFNAVCEFNDNSLPFHVGENIQVITEAATAQRLTNGVLLKNCILR